MQQGQLDQAKAMCAELITAEPQHTGALTLMSAIVHRQGDQQAAAKLLLQAASLQMGDTTAQLQLVRALRNMGAFIEANHLLTPLDKNSPEVVLSQIQLDWQSGNYATSLANFSAAVDRWPEYLDVILAYCRALLRLGQLAEAEKHILLALRRWPQQPEILHLLAVLQLDLNRPDMALECLHALPDPPQPENMAMRLRLALQLLQDKAPRAGPKRPDSIEESFNWARKQSASIRWFGTNTGLLLWALQQIASDRHTDGVVVECGVYHGFSLAQIAANTKRPIHGFDSFEGLPEEWKPGEPAGSYSTRGQIPVLAPHVQLHRG